MRGMLAFARRVARFWLLSTTTSQWSRLGSTTSLPVYATANGLVLEDESFRQKDSRLLLGLRFKALGARAACCARYLIWGIPRRQLKEEPPYGTNMAFRKEMFEKYGVFRTDLGRCGDSLIGNEDTEFGRRLMAGGERLRYEPFAVVYHSVPAERLNKRYFRAWWFAFGRAQMREKGPRTRVWGIPRFYFSLPNICLAILSSSSCAVAACS